MIDLLSFKIPVLKKRAKFLTINNDRKNTLPDHFAEVNGVKSKTSIIWQRRILFKNDTPVEMKTRKEDSCNQKA
ncbi:hypothetical protein ACSAZL_20100 [Methanosarcina sp. T3]|uniref:hypothetical protein n=1 Tax=Methanosarcina sp. T3 TaxID=3439062 RepID=UPI003F826A34